MRCVIKCDALLNATYEPRAINCAVSPLRSPAGFVSLAAASLSNAFAIASYD